MSILLQIPGFDLITGAGGEMGRSELQTPEGRTMWMMGLALAICFLSFTEPLKVLLRKNIGRKALSLPGIIAASSLYMSWALYTGGISLWAALGLLLSEEKRWVLIALAVYGLFGALVVGKVAIIVLIRGMDEHYRAKAENTTDWQGLEYRGDSWIGNTLPDWKRDRVWRIAEPKAMLNYSVKTLLNPIIGIPAILTSLSFWLNEWYQVHYKPQKMRESFIDMYIEMQKADMYNGNVGLSNVLSIVKEV